MFNIHSGVVKSDKGVISNLTRLKLADQFEFQLDKDLVTV